MKNLRSIFAEYQDPRVLRNLKIGSVLLIVLGILITFVTVPPIRHFIIPEPEVRVGPAHPVTRKHRSSKHLHNAPIKGVQSAPKLKISLVGVTPHSHSGESESVHSVGPGKGKGPHHGKGPPSVPGHPGSPPPSNTPTPSMPNNPGNGKGESNGKGKAVGQQPILKLPQTETPLDPVLEGVGKKANETINGIGKGANKTTEELPVETHIPEACLLKKC